MNPQWSTGEQLNKIIRTRRVFTSIEQRPLTNADIGNTGAICCQKRGLAIIENAEVVSFLN